MIGSTYGIMPSDVIDPDHEILKGIFRLLFDKWVTKIYIQGSGLSQPGGTDDYIPPTRKPGYDVPPFYKPSGQGVEHDLLARQAQDPERRRLLEGWLHQE